MASVPRFRRCLWRVSFFGGDEGGEVESLTCLLFAAEAFDYLDAPLARVTGADIPMPYALNLETAAAPTTPVILNVVKRVMQGAK